MLRSEKPDSGSTFGALGRIFGKMRLQFDVRAAVRQIVSLATTENNGSQRRSRAARDLDTKISHSWKLNIFVTSHQFDPDSLPPPWKNVPLQSNRLLGI